MYGLKWIYFVEGVLEVNKVVFLDGDSCWLDKFCD